MFKCSIIYIKCCISVQKEKKKITDNTMAHGANNNSHLAIGKVKELYLGVKGRMGEGRCCMLDISILARVDKLVKTETNASVALAPQDPPPTDLLLPLF